MQPKPDSILATIWNGLGQIAAAQNRLGEAKSYYDKAAATWLRTLGPEHPYYAAVLSNLGSVAGREGHHTKAQELYQRALTIDEARFGSKHPQVASDLSNIAAELFHHKKYSDALELYLRAEEIDRSSFGEQSRQTANLWRNIAIVHVACKNFDQAEVAYGKAIRCLQNSSRGSEGPVLAAWLHDYAELLRKQQRFREAEQVEVQAVRVEVRNAIRNDNQRVGGST